MNLVYVVGMGPGSVRQMTLEAQQALESCDTIVGYTVYVELLRDAFPDKEYLTTPMRREADRCRMAFEEAQKGKKVEMCIRDRLCRRPCLDGGGCMPLHSVHD